MNMNTWNFEKLQEMDSNKQFGLFTLYLCENEKNKNIVTNMYKKISNANDFKSLYYNLSGNNINNNVINVVNSYKSSLSIINQLENTASLKIAILDDWRFVEDKRKWFVEKLTSIAVNKKLIIVILKYLPMKYQSHELTIKKEDLIYYSRFFSSSRHQIVLRSSDANHVFYRLKS